MTKTDFVQFQALWKSAQENFGSLPSKEAVQMAFQALAQFPLSDVQAALMNHIQTSEYRPTVKDVFAYCSNQASRFQVSGLNVIKTERYGTVWGSPVQIIQEQCEAAA